MQNPGALTTFSQGNRFSHMYFYIRYLAPALSGQFIPANYGPGNWLFHYCTINDHGFGQFYRYDS